MRQDYGDWLVGQGYADNTQAAQLHRVQKVEEAYGRLEDHLRDGTVKDVISELTYSVADERAHRPNPSRIPINGNFRNGLQSYKNAAQRYISFLQQEAGTNALVPTVAKDGTSGVSDAPEKQRFALERDMQRALRDNIAALDPGLKIVDDGAERSVQSGFIDILCEDRSGALVVVELKAGKTDARVIGQTLGYMGDLIGEGDADLVRGIIVAHDFDQRTVSAARAIGNLSLVTYAIQFSFEALS